MWVRELKMVLRLGGKHLYLLSHLAGLTVLLFTTRYKFNIETVLSFLKHFYRI